MSNHTPRRTSTKGRVTIALDFRNPTGENEHQDTGRYTALTDVMAILVLLQGLCGDGCEVFFDFGVISITNVDLAKIRKLVEGGDAA